MKFGELLHRIVNPLVMGVIFFGLITPVGIFMRIIGRDAMNRQIQVEKPSYWIERQPPGPTSESMIKQY